MIPEFPQFKPLEIGDKEAVDAFTAQFPPYSDFEYASMWSWDVQGKMEISRLHSNLVVVFTDYLSGEKFLTFLGTHKTTDTAAALLSFAGERAYLPTLKLMPEITVSTLDPVQFMIVEDRDHFDYIYTIQSHVQYGDPALKTLRNSLNAHRRRHSGHTVIELSPTDPATETLVDDLTRRWKKGDHTDVPNEVAAFKRFLASASEFNSRIIGIKYGDTLAAFSCTVLLANGNCSCLFSRADTAYHGIYALLMHETAKLLIEKGYQFMNYEQDLGIANLRKAKMAFHPTYFLKKYTVAKI